MSLTERFNIALKSSQTKVSELAMQTNIPTASLYNLKNINSIGSKYTRDIANALNISYAWLAFGEGSMHIEKSTIQYIPIRDLQNIQVEGSQQNKFSMLESKINIDIMTRQTDKSLSPVIPNNAYIGITFEYKVTNLNYYVIKHIESNTILVRKLKDNYFCALNTMLFNNIKYDNNISIIGMVIYVSYFFQ